MVVSIRKDSIESEAQLVTLKMRKEKYMRCQQPMKCKHLNRIVNQKIIGYQDNLRNLSYRNQPRILQIHWDNLLESLVKRQKIRKFSHQAVVHPKESAIEKMNKIKTDQLFAKVALIQNFKLNQKSLTLSETLVKMNIAIVTLSVSNHHPK